MDRWWFRSAAFGCAVASCTMIAGPGFVGAALAHADLFGIDFFGHDDKSEMHHPRPGSETGVASARSAAEAPTAKIGSTPDSGPASAATAMLSPAPGINELGVARAVGRGGGGVPRVTTGRATNLPRVPSAPSARSVVIRRAPGNADSRPASGLPDLPRSPVVALAAPPREAPEPARRPVQAGPLAPSPTGPRANDPLPSLGAGGAHVPDSFRVGYAEHLRSADTGELVLAALPGVAGITGFTLIGAYAGYRQARAVQRALLAPVPTRILL